jgi:hypothetical protein
MGVTFTTELREDDGRWVAEVPALPAYCATAGTVMKPCSHSDQSGADGPNVSVRTTFPVRVDKT